MGRDSNSVSARVEQKTVACANNTFDQPLCLTGDGHRTELHAFRYPLRNILEIELLNASLFDLLGTRRSDPEVVTKGKDDFVQVFLWVNDGSKQRQAQKQKRQPE